MAAMEGTTSYVPWLLELQNLLPKLPEDRTFSVLRLQSYICSSRLARKCLIMRGIIFLVSGLDSPCGAGRVCVKQEPQKPTFLSVHLQDDASGMRINDTSAGGNEYVHSMPQPRS
jgi:hypothetical protein